MADGVHANDSPQHAPKTVESSVKSGENGQAGAPADRKCAQSECKRQNGAAPRDDDDDDCRKKRCVDRYDSSESSDSGVAVLSCGSSTASSDITDPGSPFSTASNHSEDSGVAAPPPRMPPAQTAHHPPWLWTDALTAKSPRPMQQGKITEYFKTQLRNSGLRAKPKPPPTTQTIGKIAIIAENRRPIATVGPAPQKAAGKSRKPTTTAPPRKILPAPSKTNNLYQFAPVIAPVAFPFLTAKAAAAAAAQPADNLFLPQFVNCVKLNAIVLPPHRLLSVDTALPTVLPARVKTAEAQTRAPSEAPPPERPPSWIGPANQKSPSPADSEDSGVSSRGSLEISVDEPIVAEQQPKKSPILSQPKTIRFPAVQHQKGKDSGADSGGKSTPHVNDGGRCRWNDCAGQFDTSGALLEHLQVKHVISQSHADQEQYVCLWRGCKVHGRKSCSISWLERHVLAHAGTKPFRCIVDGCGHRFNSQLMLERHVNSHFSGDGAQHGGAAGKRSPENGGGANGNNVKLFKRNGRIIRFRRQPWSARMFDFIDSGIMEGLQHKLVRMTQARTLGGAGGGVAGQMVTFRGAVMARRTDRHGAKELLVRWHPNDVIADEWIAEKDYQSTRTLSMTSLSWASREALTPVLFPGAAQSPQRRKQRRKPVAKSTT